MSKTNKILSFHVYSIDVWGNAEDGWEQNDYARVGILEIPQFATDQQLFEALKENGFLFENVKIEQCEFDWFGDGEMGELRQAEDQKPVYQFREILD